MNIKKKVRSAVSKDRIRFNDKKHNLDLSYITNNLIAMAFPASGIEATYRNDIDEVSRMLQTYHKNNYMIWNLSGRPYDYSKFNHQVLNFGFPDHHSPPLDLLFQIIVSMDNWLSASPEHVAVIHCVGGKGRTGTVISCYLIFTGYFADPQEALLHFAYMRSMKERGVTQTSQKRYVTYFQNILRNTVRPHPKMLRIRRVVMTAIPCWTKQGCRPYVNIYHTRSDPRQLVHTTRNGPQTRLYHSDESSSIIWDVDCMVKGDVLIKFYHLKENQEKVLDKTKEGSKKKFEQSMFRFSFHTAFVELDQGGLILKKADVDIYHKPKRFRDSLAREEFGVIVIMEEVEEHMAQLYGEEDAAITATYEQFFQKITSERIRSKHEQLAVVNDSEDESNNADTNAETDDDLVEEEDEEDEDTSQGELERSTSSDVGSLDSPRAGWPEGVRASPKGKKRSRRGGSEIKNEASSPKERKETKKESDESVRERKDSAGQDDPPEKAATADPEKQRKKKGSMRGLKKKLGKLKKPSGEGGSSTRRRKKDKKDKEKDTKDKEKDNEDKEKDNKKPATSEEEDEGKDRKEEAGVDQDGEEEEERDDKVCFAEPSSLGTSSPSGTKSRRPVTLYAKVRHSLEGNQGISVSKRGGGRPADRSGTWDKEKAANGHHVPHRDDVGAADNGEQEGKGKGDEEVKNRGRGVDNGLFCGDHGEGDNNNSSGGGGGAEKKSGAKLRMRSSSMKDVFAGHRASLPSKPLPPTPPAPTAIAEQDGPASPSSSPDDSTSSVAHVVTSDQSTPDDAATAAAVVVQPSSSPTFKTGFSTSARAPGWGPRRSPAALSSHRCSVPLGKSREG